MNGVTHPTGMRAAIALVVALVFASPAGVGTHSLGKGTDPMLAAWETALDARGIDVVQGAARDLGFRTARRPRLAKLAGFPAPTGDHARPAPDDWRVPFERGAFDYLAAFRPADTAIPSGAASPDIDQFLHEWSRASQNGRIFMAYTKDDAAAAKTVADVLRAQGYVVFTYIRGNDAAPWAKPEVVGQLFREAGHHFVIDTPNARKSVGVVFEALALARLKETTKQAAPARASGSGCPALAAGRSSVK